MACKSFAVMQLVEVARRLPHIQSTSARRNPTGRGILRRGG